MYAELIGNYKNIRIKNLMGNKLYLSTTYEHFNLGKQDEVKDRVKHINKLKKKINSEMLEAIVKVCLV